MKNTARILVVDDDPDILATTLTILQAEGYDVQGASTGRAALGLVDTWLPHLILMDIRMPDMDGWAFLAAYRQRDVPHAPVVVYTATSDYAERALAEGAVAFLNK